MAKRAVSAVWERLKRRFWLGGQRAGLPDARIWRDIVWGGGVLGR